MLRVKPSWQLCLGMVLGALLLNFGGLHLVPIVCAAYFFAGGLAAMSPAHWRRQAAFVLGVGVAACVATGYLRDLNRIPFAILLALPCLLMALAQGWPWLDRWSRQIEAAGNLTYSSYLLHFPLQLIVAILVAATGISLPLADPRFLLGYIGLTLAAATLCYRLFELPAQDWLRRKTLGSPAKAYR
jgi:peptidoglycan/LPS O-acetylase OafA/YrhL